MSTTDTPKPIPRHIAAGVACSTLAIVLFVLAVAYYCVVAAGTFPPPPVGIAPLWATVIAVLCAVPISLWAASVAARPNKAELAELRAEVRAVLDFTIEAARRDGRWQGIVSELRNNPPAPGATAAVVDMMSRRTGNSG